MHHADIHASLVKKGVQQQDIAAKTNVTPTTVSLVIRGKTTSFKVAKAISEVVGKPVNLLWPGKYSRQLRKAA
jgi:lambda repressor-like predicted transcriptional regulator